MMPWNQPEADSQLASQAGNAAIGGPHLEEDRHGCNDPLLSQSRAQAVEVVGVVGVDLHLWKKQSRLAAAAAAPTSINAGTRPLAQQPQQKNHLVYLIFSPY